MDPNPDGEDIRPEIAHVVNISISVAPLHGPDDHDPYTNLTSTGALIALATEVLELGPTFRINIFRSSPRGRYDVLGANHPHSDQDDVYINIAVEPRIIQFDDLQLWNRLAHAIRNRIQPGQYSCLVTINGGNGVRYPRSHARREERDAL